MAITEIVRLIVQINQSAMRNFDMLTEKVKSATEGLGFFRMEMLGVMFFGMGMSRFFKGLINPAFQAAGAFEIMNTTMQILFLPTAIAVTDELIRISDAIMGLPEPVQSAIGVTALLGAGIGELLMTIGMATLGIDAIVRVFKNYGGTIKNVTKALKPGLVAALVAVGASILSTKLKTKEVTEVLNNFRDNVGFTPDLISASIFVAMRKVAEKLRVSLRNLLADIGLVKRATTDFSLFDRLFPAVSPGGRSSTFPSGSSIVINNNVEVSGGGFGDPFNDALIREISQRLGVDTSSAIERSLRGTG